MSVCDMCVRACVRVCVRERESVCVICAVRGQLRRETKGKGAKTPREKREIKRIRTKRCSSIKGLHHERVHARDSAFIVVSNRRNEHNKFVFRRRSQALVLECKL